MKMKFLSAVAITALMFASCSQDENGVNNEVSTDGARAFLSVSVNLPEATPGTFTDAGPVNQQGTTAESKLDKIYVVTFDDSYNRLGTVVVTDGAAFGVKETTKKILVVVNPTATVYNQINNAATYAIMNQTIASAAELGEMTTADKFMMVSSGEGTGAYNGLIAVTPSVAADESTTAVDAAKADAVTKKATIAIDRVMSKVTLANTTPSVEPAGATAAITGALLNTTNTKYNIYTERVAFAGTSKTPASVYRQDANYTAIAKPAYETEFNWLHNPDGGREWKAKGAYEYCLENTMAAAAQDYNNTTKMIIKAQYAPDGFTLGESWFRVGGLPYTLAQLDAKYSDSKTAETDKAKYRLFLDTMLGAGRTKGWTAEAKANGVVTIDDLENVSDDGGYMATKVGGSKADGNYLIAFYRKSVCYYAVNIKHDNRLDAFTLGRWGVVRNNWYTLSVNSITQPGLPYIPDPTDPNIPDPENPDPDNPDPDDQKSAFLAVTITVNPWATWTQDVNL